MSTKKLCKITDENGQSYMGCRWGVGITYTTSGDGELCSSGWLHYYEHPLLAVLLNPMHGNYNPTTMRLWAIEAAGKQKYDRGLKAGCTKLTTIKEIPLPQITTAQRVRFAILCAMEVETSEQWLVWAHNWLNKQDRTYIAADAAADAAAAAAARAAYAAAAYADAARAAAAAAAVAAAYAADAAAAAAVAAADAARAAAVNGAIDLIAIAKKAITEEKG